MKIGTPAFQRFVVDVFPSKPVQALKGLIDTIQNTADMMHGEHAKKLKNGSAADEKNMMSLLCTFIFSSLNDHILELIYHLSYISRGKLPCI